MLLGAGAILSPDLVMWACSVCKKSNKHYIRLCVLIWMYMTFHFKFKKWHTRKNTYTKHCKFNLTPVSFTYSPSMEKVIPLLEIIRCSRADCHTTQVFIAYLRSLKKRKLSICTLVSLHFNNATTGRAEFLHVVVFTF